jgi:voltage-gated potassium channel
MELFIRATDTFKELIVWYLGLVLFGALLFSFFEGKPYADSLWWAFVTALTVGYGDMYPVTLGGRIVGLVLMHSVVFVIAPLIIARLLSVIFLDANKFTNEEQEQIKKDVAEIKSMLQRERGGNQAPYSP